jgi:iron complex outermembrane receptor protein
LANFRIGATLGHGKYDVALWANNAFDKHYFTTSGLVSVPGASSFAVSGQPGTPRIIGATFRVNY